MEELECADDEPFLLEEDLAESEGFVPEKADEMERLAARESSSGARDEDDEVREGMTLWCSLFKSDQGVEK